MLRSCYEAPARFYVDGPVSKIRFYFAKPGATWFTGPHCFWPLSQELDLQNPEGVGELTGQGSRRYYRGTNVNDLDGSHVEGRPQDFAGESHVPWAAPHVPTPAARLPHCDFPASGVAFGGFTFEVWGGSDAAIGGALIGGYAVETVEEIGGVAVGGYAVESFQAGVYGGVTVGGFFTETWATFETVIGGIAVGGDAVRVGEEFAAVAFGGESAETWQAFESVNGGVIVGGFFGETLTGTIASLCSQRFLPDTLHFRVVGGPCDGSHTIHYHQTADIWWLLEPVGSCSHPDAATVILQCDGSSWNLDVSVAIQGYAPSFVSDDPFVLVFEGVDFTACGCGLCTVIISDRFVAAGGDVATGGSWVTVGGIASSSTGWEESWSGGVVAGGITVMGGGHSAIGGVVVGGTVTMTSGFLEAVAGGVNVGGAASMASGSSATAAGGVTVGGTVVEDFEMIPVGTIVQFGAGAAPAGWLVCNGGSVSKATFPALWAVIGDLYVIGSPQANTFNLPDFSGRAPIGTGQGQDLTNRTLGQKLGAETHILTAAEMPSHTHTQTTVDGGAGAFTGNQSRADAAIGNFPRAPTLATGGGGGHNNMQPSLAVTFIIKAT